MITIELNNENCKEYTTEQIDKILGLTNNESIDLLSKKLKKNISIGNKMDYKTEEFKVIALEQLEIKKRIIELYGEKSLVEILIGKKRKDGHFKQLNSKGNKYGNF